MNLLVNAYTRSPDDKFTIIAPDDHSKQLAGFESYRQQLYGSQASQAARSLGLQLLPTLDGSDLYAEGEDVARLKAEAELVLANIDLFSEGSPSAPAMPSSAPRRRRPSPSFP